MSGIAAISISYRIIRELGARTPSSFVAVRAPDEICIAQRFSRAVLGAETIALLFRDARALEKSWHPNLARVRHVDLIGGDLWIASELVEGATLADLGDVPADVRLRIVVDVLHGLSHLHGLRDGRRELVDMVHGDVGAENIIVGRDGVARLVGIFRPRGELGQVDDLRDVCAMHGDPLLLGERNATELAAQLRTGKLASVQDVADLVDARALERIHTRRLELAPGVSGTHPKHAPITEPDASYAEIVIPPRASADTIPDMPMRVIAAPPAWRKTLLSIGTPKKVKPAKSNPPPAPPAAKVIVETPTSLRMATPGPITTTVSTRIPPPPTRSPIYILAAGAAIAAAIVTFAILERARTTSEASEPPPEEVILKTKTKPTASSLHDDGARH